jgi:hypothetical protein
MGFSISTYNLASIKSYEEADAHFNNTPKPRTTRWLEHQRPLKNTRFTHLALEKGHLNGVAYYDCRLYDTPLVRYFEPNDKGERAVWLAYHHAQSSSRFTAHMGWWNGKQVHDDQNQPANIVYATSTGGAERVWGDSFTCKLLFNSDNRLVRDKSAHIPVFRRSSTATMRARRKALKAKFDVMLAIMELQFDEMVHSHELRVADGEPFSRSRDLRHHIPSYYTASKIIRSMAGEAGHEPTDDERTTLTQFVVALSKHTLGNIMNRRFHDAVRQRTGWFYKDIRNDYRDDGTLSQQPEDIQAAVTPSYKEVCSNAMACLVGMVGLDADARIPYPQFPANLPRTYYWGEPSKWLEPEAYAKLVSRKGVIY